MPIWAAFLIREIIMNNPQDEIARLNKGIVERDIEINLMRTKLNNTANELVQAIKEIERLNDIIHNLRDEIFLLSALKH